MKALLRAFGVFALLFVSSGAYAEQFKVLLFTKTAGWHHKSINAAVTAFEKMAENHYFTLDWQEDSSLFNDKNLANYDVIVFLMTSGDVLNEAQQQAMQKFIQAGKGFVGVHSAADTEYDWPWYGKLVGHHFVIHPRIQSAQLRVINRKFPGVEYLPDSGLWTDEWYEFGPQLSDNLTYVLTVDESTYSPHADWGSVKGRGMGDFHPISWYQKIDGGRAFYTALGHMPATYQNKAFIEHLFGGLYWAATGKGISQ